MADAPVTLPAPTGEEFHAVRRQAAITAEQFSALLAVLVSNGHVTPDQAAFILRPTGNFATLNQPPASPFSGVPTGGA